MADAAMGYESSSAGNISKQTKTRSVSNVNDSSSQEPPANDFKTQSRILESSLRKSLQSHLTVIHNEPVGGVWTISINDGQHLPAPADQLSQRFRDERYNGIDIQIYEGGKVELWKQTFLGDATADAFCRRELIPFKLNMRRGWGLGEVSPDRLNSGKLQQAVEAELGQIFPSVAKMLEARATKPRAATVDPV